MRVVEAARSRTVREQDEFLLRYLVNIGETTEANTITYNQMLLWLLYRDGFQKTYEKQYQILRRSSLASSLGDLNFHNLSESDRALWNLRLLDTVSVARRIARMNGQSGMIVEDDDFFEYRRSIAFLTCASTLEPVGSHRSDFLSAGTPSIYPIQKPYHKILLLGDGGIGKTTWLIRVLSGEFKLNTELTLPDFHSLKYEVPRKGTFHEEYLGFWDFGGQNHWRFFVEQCSESAELAILFFDITRFKTFLNLPEWVQLARHYSADLPIILVGLKADCLECSVDENDIQEFTTQYGVDSHYLASCKTGDNCTEVLNRVIHLIHMHEWPDVVDPLSPNELRSGNLGLLGANDVGKVEVLKMLVAFLGSQHNEMFEAEILKADFAGEAILDPESGVRETRTVHPNRIRLRWLKNNNLLTIFAPGGDRGRAVVKMGVITISRMAKEIVCLFDISRPLKPQLAFFSDVRDFPKRVDVLWTRCEQPGTKLPQVLAKSRAEVEGAFKTRGITIARWGCINFGEDERAALTRTDNLDAIRMVLTRET
jgi:small GTP-binding protein